MTERAGSVRGVLLRKHGGGLNQAVPWVAAVEVRSRIDRRLNEGLLAKEDDTTAKWRSRERQLAQTNDLLEQLAAWLGLENQQRPGAPADPD